MANALYDKGREGFLDGSIDWDTDDIRVILACGSFYSPDPANDLCVDAVDVQARTAVSSVLTGKTRDNGVAGADNITFSLVTGEESEYLVIYQDTGNESTSRLIAVI